MKVAVVVLFAFLVAGAAASVQQAVPVSLEKNIIDDALQLYQCLTQSIAILQDSIDSLISTVTGINSVLQGLMNQFNACLAIGGDNPSIIDQIQQATCLLALVDTVRDTITGTINDVQSGVGQVVIAGNNVLACFG